MSFQPQTAVLRLQREVPDAERKIDEALVATTSILQTLIRARSVIDVPAVEAQQTVLRMVKAQNALLEASKELLRTHSELSRYHETYMGADEPTCPPSSATLANDVEILSA